MLTFLYSAIGEGGKKVESRSITDSNTSVMPKCISSGVLINNVNYPLMHNSFYHLFRTVSVYANTLSS